MPAYPGFMQDKGVALPSLTYTATNTTTEASVWSEAMDLGTANAGDKIVIVFGHSNTPTAMTGATVGGNTMFDTNAYIPSSLDALEAWYFDDTSGTVGGSVTVTGTASGDSTYAMGAMRIANVATGVPSAFATSTANPTPSFTITVATNGILVLASFQRENAARTMAWSAGFTEHSEVHAGSSFNFSVASQFYASGGSKSVSGTWSGSASPTRNTGIAMAFDPV